MQTRTQKSKNYFAWDVNRMWNPRYSGLKFLVNSSHKHSFRSNYSKINFYTESLFHPNLLNNCHSNCYFTTLCSDGKRLSPYRIRKTWVNWNIKLILCRPVNKNLIKHYWWFSCTCNLSCLSITWHLLLPSECVKYHFLIKLEVDDEGSFVALSC